VGLREPGATRLAAGSRFSWRTFGVGLTTEIQEFVPEERIAWEAPAPGVQAYHAWLILPTALGCKVITEETQYGWKCRLAKRLMPHRMIKYHQLWLEGLKAKAETA
jgi:hypothetical protein